MSDNNTIIASDGPLVSKELLFAFRLVNFLVLCVFFSLLGCVTNVINVVIFSRMGFKDSINISFVGLAVADFWACVTMIVACFGLNPFATDMDLPFDAQEIQFAVAATPHLIFSKIATIITAFITFERCICVAMPLKVKDIITCRRVKIFVVLTYVLVTATSIPIPYTYRLKMKFFPSRNKTLLGLFFSDDRKAIQDWVLPIHNFFYSIAAFIFIAVCTSVLVVTLQKKSAWRKTAMTKTSSDESTSKEKKISKMVIFVSSWFIVCFLPSVVLLVVMLVDREVAVTGSRANLLYTMASFTLTMETINAAINLFIYYRNSSNYKVIFKQIFHCIFKTTSAAGETAKQ